MYTFVNLKGRGVTFPVINNPDSKPHFLAFKKMETATRYKQYLSKFHKKHGFWPNMNLDSGKSVQEYSKKLYDRIDDYDESLNLIMYNNDEVLQFMMTTNAPVMACIDFEVIQYPDNRNKFDIHLKAEELRFDQDLDYYIKVLDYIYEVSEEDV